MRVITNPPEIKYDEKLRRNILRFSAFPESEPENVFWIETEFAPTSGVPLKDETRARIKECLDILGRKVATYLTQNFNP